MSEQEVRRSISIDAPPSAVWEAVHDFGGHGKWMPGAAEAQSHMVWSGDPNTPGTERRFELPGNSVFAERLNRIDHQQRQLAYSIVEAPLAISGHEATISVDADGPASVVRWTARFESDDATARELDAFMGTQNFEPGLAGLKSYVEGSRTA
ncbi:SRPBCC family protein [Arthrobacter sp. 7Tela_A1]|uniref:SRPBCC family protein n=1 Tax=Arthrobacter sp. 7Tela_A1 TaxID=3093745 RepID=UPI003BB51E35